MEIGTVPLLGVAGIKRVAMSPSGAGFVITHVCQDVFVERTAFFVISAFNAGDLLHRELRRKTRCGNKLVRFEEALSVSHSQYSRFAGRSLAAHDVIYDFKAVLILIGFGGFGVQ